MSLSGHKGSILSQMTVPCRFCRRPVLSSRLTTEQCRAQRIAISGSKSSV
jgi:hypothetical protein